MKLFKYENYKVVVDPEVLLLKPFKELYKRDKSKNKERAMMELSYIYFLLDPRSDFLIYTDEEERSNEIKKAEGFDAKWLPDKVMLEAMKLYEKLTQSTSSLILRDCNIAVTKVRTFLRDFDLMSKNDKGGLLVPINTFSSAIKLLTTLSIEINNAEKEISKELAEAGRIKGQRSKTISEDGLKSLMP